MKASTFVITIASLLCACPASRAALNIPSDGSDGVFAPSSHLEVDLDWAANGAWDANNSANAGKGIYYVDGNWGSALTVIVFKYSSVNIPAGVTVSFKNHPSHAAVVWLVSGSVVINGTLNLRGQNGTRDAILALTPTEPGPGGFRGGAYGPLGASAGYGPGGRNSHPFGSSASGTYAGTYGDPQLVRLVGGSGSAADGNGIPSSGGGGGGAILIASALNITVNGTVDARGGTALESFNGSGGAIRLIAESVTGTGSLLAVEANMNPGRIRIETPSLAPGLTIQPNTVSVPPASPPQIWPAATAPTVRIVSINGVASPADPFANLANSPDFVMDRTGQTEVIVRTTNFPLNGVVQVRDVKKYGPDGWATFPQAVAGSTFESATWVASIPFVGGFTTLQARATVP